MYQSYLKTLRIIVLVLIAIGVPLLAIDALRHPIDWLGIATILVAGYAAWKSKEVM